MKNVVVSALCLTFVLIIVWGAGKKDSYTDIIHEEKFPDSMYVAELPETICKTECDRMKEELDQCPYIIKVKPIKEPEHLFMVDRQLVQIITSYKGDLKENEQVYLFNRKCNTVVWDDVKSLELCFVNILNSEHEYLVFCDSIFAQSDTETKVVEISSQYIINPAFCYDEINNEIVPTSDESTYVKYIYVKNNEFFATSETGIDEMVSLKHHMIEKYK